MSKILGLDLGSNSIGWALIDDEGEGRIIDAGVRIFQEGVNRNTQGKEVSKNANRRDARSARRRNSRFKMRRDALTKALKKIGLFPDNAVDITDFLKIDPYEARKHGLDHQLNLLEIGRCLYHINQRRGFLSNRKTGVKEDGKIYEGTAEKTGIDDARAKLDGHQFRTIGEYLASLKPEEKRRRNRYTLREWYRSEFNYLWDLQQKYYPDILTEKDKQYIGNIIFYQRRLRSQKSRISFCTFEPKKRCSPKSSPVFQYFRILEQVNRLRITTGNRLNSPLSPEERKILIEKLNTVPNLDFRKIIKLLKFPEDIQINIDTEKLYGNNTYAEILKIFGKDRFNRMSEPEKYNIWHTIHFAVDDGWLENYGREKWQLNAESIKKLLSNTIESKPNDGYARLSHKAMLKIIPNLEVGQRYDEAVFAAGFHHSQPHLNKTQAEFLPDPPDIRNPIVMQALFQLKKVINSLIQYYGKPDIIRVELARELKLPKDRRDRIRIENLVRQNEAEKIRSRLTQEYHIQNPTRDDVIRYRLWVECNETDPYSGDRIGLSELFTNKYQIEHIIPYSRSLDDGFANKTLCRYDWNKDKNNRTPFEAFGHKPVFEHILNRVKKFQGNKPFIKFQKFADKEIDAELSEDFFHRQFNDTAYISREAFAYLKKISPKVQIVKGMATAQLRYLWGLNSILSNEAEVKLRDDHRHHTIDALVVACTNPIMLHKLSSYWKYNSMSNVTESKFPLPWLLFRQQTTEAINRVLVSYHFRNRVRGKLHEDTNYGFITDPASGKKEYVVRKQIEALTSKNVNNILNPETRDLIKKQIRKFGIDPEQKSYTIPKEVFAEPLIHPKTGHPIKAVRVKIPASNMIALYGPERKLYVEPGKNHHIEIFANESSTKKEGYVITLYETTQRKKAGLPIVDRTPRNEYFPRFITAIEPNEMFLIDLEPDQIKVDHLDYLLISKNLYRIQKMSSTTQIILRHHTVALTGENDPGVVRKLPNTLVGTKVKITPIGKIEFNAD